MTPVHTSALTLLAMITLACAPSSITAQTLTPHQQLALRHLQGARRDQHRHGRPATRSAAAEAMAARLRAAGFAGRRRAGARRPRRARAISSRGCAARASASRSCCSRISTSSRRSARTGRVDPFKLIEQDGYFYGRGTGDDKAMAAIFVANLIRYKQEGYKPDRDIILALRRDEESGDANGVGMLAARRTIATDRRRVRAERGRRRRPQGTASRMWNSVQASEKVVIKLQARGDEPGRPQLAADARTTRSTAWPKRSRASRKFSFPFKLNEITRAFFERTAAAAESPQTAADMRAIAAGSPGLDALSIRGCRRTRSTTRSCARPASPRSSRAGTPTTRCRRGRAPRSIAASCRVSRLTRCLRP